MEFFRAAVLSYTRNGLKTKIYLNSPDETVRWKAGAFYVKGN
jgi:hypothetical protein